MTDQNPYAPPTWDLPPEDKPKATAGFLPEGRGVDAGRGASWLGEAWGLVKNNALVWVGIFIIHMVIVWVLSIVPYAGQLVGYALGPVFSAGYALGAHAVMESRPLEVGTLFAGFNKHPGRLFALGAFYAGGILVAAVVMVAFSFGSLGLLMKGGGAFKGDFDIAAMTPIFLGVAVAGVLMIPVSMAIYYAPALVVLNDLGPGAALRASFLAASKNVLPFIVFSLVTMGLAIAAAIPCGLGLLVLMPVATVAVYTSYRDVFFEAPRD